MPDPRARGRSSYEPRLDCVRTFERGGVSVARAGSERAAEGDVRKPEMAARPSRVSG